MVSRRYPPLLLQLAKQLSTVEATDGIYRPCIVTLQDGSVQDRVYLAEAEPWFRRWGVWPEDDSGKLSIDIRNVVAIADSPSRLPPQAANALYDAGESGMGYTLFTVAFADGSSVPFVSGNAIDFIDYPPGQSRDTVVNVVPHAGRDAPAIRQAPLYYWCLYDGFRTTV